MKLLTRTTLYFLTIALFVLFAGGILFYFVFRYMMNREVKRELITEIHQIILHPPDKNVGVDSLIFDLPVHFQIIPVKRITMPDFVFRDTLFFDNIIQGYQPYRILNYETLLNGKPVRISISKTLFFSDEIIEYVAFITLLLSLFLFLFVIVFNRYFFSRIWGSFLETIDIIKDYNISDKKELTLPQSEITEFNMLNQVFEKLNERIKKDYRNLKEFIENISHEIQNPLAIIKSRIDLLQQKENLDKSQLDLIQSIQGSATRLSNIDKSLILLSKIDNDQFLEMERVEITETINLHLKNFEDILLSKNISLSVKYNNPVIVRADPALISIMLLNLLKNSIFHNLPSGSLEILTNENSLTIKNTGKKLDIIPEDLFKRFTKSSSKSDSLGLGLAIVKKICDYYNFNIQYTCQDNLHILAIIFC